MVIEQTHAPNKKVLEPIQQYEPNSSTSYNNNQGKGKVNMITPTNENQPAAVNFIKK